MKIRFLFIFFFVLCAIASAQSTERAEDSLRNILNTPNVDIAIRIEALEYLSMIELGRDNNEALKLGDEALELALKINDTRLIGIAYQRSGAAASYLGDNEIATKYNQKAIDILGSVQDSISMLDAYNTLAGIEERKGNVKQALLYYDICLGVCKRKAPHKYAVTAYNVALIYEAQGDYAKATEFYQKALEDDTKYNNANDLAYDYKAIGDIERLMKNFDGAKKCFSKSIEIGINEKNTSILAYTKASLADLYMDLKDYELAYKEIMEARVLAKDLDEVQLNALLEESFGHVEYHRNHYEIALVHLYKAIDIFKSLDNPSAQSQSELFLGKTLIAMGHYPEALGILNTANERMAEEIDIILKIELEEALSKVHAKMGNYEKAFAHQQENIKLKDAFYERQKTHALFEARQKFNTDQEEMRLKMAEQKLSAIRLKGILTIGVLVFLLAGIIIIALMMRQRDIKAFNKTLYNKNQAIAQQNQRLKVSNTELTEYAYIVSHDLKEPLRTIGSYAGLIRRRIPAEAQTEDIKEYLGFVTTSAQRMSSMLDTLLVYASIDQDRPEPTSINLDNTIWQIKTQLQDLFKRRNAVLNVESLPEIKGNPTQIFQLFQNLIANAVKFNENEVPTVQVSVKALQGASYRFEIKDNGIGIAEEQQSKIFRLFRRLHRDEYEGTGIGLALCQKIVLLHGGTIGVESTEGKGSTFWFTLPA